MTASTAGNAIWAIIGLLVCVGLWWTARRIDPHWCAKDGRAFTCKIRPVEHDSNGEGRWRDARATVDGDRVRLTLKGLGVPMAPFQAHDLIGRSPAAPDRQAIYLLGLESSYVVRIPLSSRAVAVLDEILSRRP
jgi:hypothetical protein